MKLRRGTRKSLKRAGKGKIGGKLKGKAKAEPYCYSSKKYGGTLGGDLVTKHTQSCRKTGKHRSKERNIN